MFSSANAPAAPTNHKNAINNDDLVIRHRDKRGGLAFQRIIAAVQLLAPVTTAVFLSLPHAPSTCLLRKTESRAWERAEVRVPQRTRDPSFISPARHVRLLQPQRNRRRLRLQYRRYIIWRARRRRHIPPTAPRRRTLLHLL